MIRMLKYPLTGLTMFRVELMMPNRAKVRAFRFQRDVPTIWAEVRNDDTNTRRRIFRLATTGAEIGEPVMDYIGSDMSPDHSFVLHCYELWPT